MPISENDLADARQAWGDGLIELSRIFEFDGTQPSLKFNNPSDMIGPIFEVRFAEV